MKQVKRMCAISRELIDKKEMLRIVKTNKNEIYFDKDGKINGRGLYLKKDLNIIEKAFKRKLIENSFKLDVPEGLKEELISNI